MPYTMCRDMLVYSWSVSTIQVKKVDQKRRRRDMMRRREQTVRSIPSP